MAKTQIQNQAPAVEAGENPKIFLRLIKSIPVRIKGRLIDLDEYDVKVGTTTLREYYDSETILGIIRQKDKIYAIIMDEQGSIWIDEFEIEGGGQE